MRQTNEEVLMDQVEELQKEVKKLDKQIFTIHLVFTGYFIGSIVAGIIL